MIYLILQVSFNMPLQNLDLSELFLTELALEWFDGVLLGFSLLPHLDQPELAVLEGKCLTFFSLLYCGSRRLRGGVVVGHLDDALHHPRHGGVKDQRSLGRLAGETERLPGLLSVYLRAVLS